MGKSVDFQYSYQDKMEIIKKKKKKKKKKNCLPTEAVTGMRPEVL